jgi:hypothetical protein
MFDIGGVDAYGVETEFHALPAQSPYIIFYGIRP